MIVNNPDNAGLTPGPGISLEILSNSFSALTAVSFALERLVGAVSKRDVITFEVEAATEVVKSNAMSDAASVAGRSVRGCLARDGVGFGVVVLEGCCWTRLGPDKEEGCHPGGLRLLGSSSIEEVNSDMMVQNKGLAHEASP
jgi:hypothetical protein